MEREEILARIEEIREELRRDGYRLLRDKIMQRRFHLHRSDRNPISRRFIEKLRARLMSEVELVLQPLLDDQREINLRFLEEIERLKKACLSDRNPDHTGNSHEPPHREDPGKSEE